MWDWLLWIGSIVWGLAILRYLLLLWFTRIDFD